MRSRFPPARRAPRARLIYNSGIPTDFFDYFAAIAEKLPDRPAAELQRKHDVERMTYRQMADLSARAASWLDAQGVMAGERVVLLAENDGVWCGSYLGVLRAGAVAVPLDTNYNATQVAKLLTDCGASAVFTSERFADLARAALREYRDLPMAIMRTDFEGLPVAATRRSTRPEDPAVILYTSGTTADPKGVVLTHANIVAERSAAFQVVKVDERDAVLSVLPLFHALAQMANLLLPFSAGARVVFLESLNTTELTRALRERGITAFVCVPQFFYLLHQRIEHEVGMLAWPARVFVRVAARLNLFLRESVRINPGRFIFRQIHQSLGPDLRILITGGARFDPVINRALFALGFTIQQAYGLTECSGGATVSRAGDPHLASVGPALPGVELRVAQADGEDGEVLIRGGIVMKGYYKRPDQNATTLADGWLHTGDLGYLDRGGRLHITGRSKEIIVLGSGKNIYPEEIEAHYEKSPFIQELCVVGLSRPGEPTSERLHALVRPDAEAMRARGAVNIRELLRFEIESLSVQLPAHKRILGYDVTLEPLPRTTTRKLKRFEIMKRLSEAQRGQRPRAGEPARAWPDDPATSRILEVVREQVTSDVPLVPDAHLELDLGLDSMERVELLVHLTGALQVQISEEESQQLHTVGALVEACRLRLPEGWERAARVHTWERLLHETPADDEFLRELRKAKLFRAGVFFVAVKAVYVLCAIMVGLRTRGVRQLPDRGPYLISPNHQSYVDAFMVVGALPFRAFRDMFFVGAAEYFQTPLMRWLARTLNVVPVDPDSNLVKAMQAGAHGLSLGKVLVLFPEGERSIDGEVKPFRKGAAILSRHLGAPIVPVAIDGTWDIWARGRPINWNTLLPWSGTRVRVEFGAPLPVADTDDYAAQTELLRERVIGMWQRLHAERTLPR
ncbi:MAG: AMP-binding protein [Acidobacteriota bacterium]